LPDEIDRRSGRVRLRELFLGFGVAARFRFPARRAGETAQRSPAGSVA
jgi:hypothetical protein